MRKNLILIFLLSFTLSCLTTLTTQKSVFFVDYSKFDNFFITESNSVSFAYLPIGSISISYTGYTIIPENPFKGKTKNSKPDDIYYFNTKERNYNSHNSALDEAIDIAVNETKSKGGNGIINFNYSPVYNTSGIQTGWFVDGMAINRDIK